ncbi:MAG: hypothetical protein FWG30_11120 [Eubacteriaceae bacterium]|nr:hypothetical protein [Eubacteriaceae bacterium]
MGNKKGAAALLLIIMMSAFTILALAAALPTSTLQLTNNPNESITLSLKGNSLTVSNVPANEAFRYVSLRMAGQSYEPVDTQGIQAAQFTASGLNRGTFTARVYTGPSPGEMSEYINLPIYWNGSALSFSGFDVLEHNQEARAGIRADSDALKIYLQQRIDPSIPQQAIEITSGIGDDYSKALAIHDWICENIYYNMDAYESGHSGLTVTIGDDYYTRYNLACSYWAMLALRDKVAVCQGYAALNTAMLRSIGIPSFVVSGYALGIDSATWPEGIADSDISNHAWSEAYIGGRWIAIDPTWDTNNSFRLGERIDSSGLQSHRYFDITTEALSLDHCYSKGVMIGELKLAEQYDPNLNAPSSFGAAKETDTSARLTWSKADGADGYDIFRSDTPQGPFSRKAYTTSPDRITLINSGLYEGLAYYYQIRSYAIRDGVRVTSPFSETFMVQL